jgi:hypothetical protein
MFGRHTELSRRLSELAAPLVVGVGVLRISTEANDDEKKGVQHSVS